MPEELLELESLIAYIRRRVIGFFAAVILLAIGVFVMWQELVVTYVICDEKSVVVLSYTDNTDLIIGRSGVPVKENNNVVLDYFDADVKGSLIIITKPHDVLFYDEGRFSKVVTVSGTVGDAVISCCGIGLPPLEAEDVDEDHRITMEKVEDEQFITVHHPMTKSHFISFIAYLTSDRVQFVKLYPEGNAETRLNFRGRGYVYIYCNKHGLMKMKI